MELTRPYIEGWHFISYLLNGHLYLLLGCVLSALFYHKPPTIIFTLLLLLNYLWYRAYCYPFLDDFYDLFHVFTGEVVIIDLLGLYYLPKMLI